MPMSNRAFAWVADNALNALAYLVLHVASPIRAGAWLKRAGWAYAPLGSIDEARKMKKRLGNRGTCLSRSIAVAARCPGSQVVIGVQPGNSVRASGRPVDAHAWVEIEGVALENEASAPWVELGRIDLRS